MNDSEFSMQMDGLALGRSIVHLRKAEYMGIDAESLGIFGGGRMSKLSSNCFSFSGGSSASC